MRDHFSESSIEDYVKFSKELATAVCPIKAMHKNVARIELREKTGKLLRRILMKIDEDGKECEQLSLPNSKVLPKNEASDRNIVDIYTFFRQSLSNLNEEDLRDLCNFRAQVFLILQIPSDTKIARSIVMGQGKGKNLETVDEYKGLVCFTSIDNESRQDETLDKWNELCDEVGRTTVEDACTLLAQIHLSRCVKQKGNEVDIFDDYLKSVLIEKEIDGATFFDKHVKPAAQILYKFRNGQMSVLGKNPVATPSLQFLASVSKIQVSAETELVALKLLMKHIELTDPNEKLLLEDQLKKLERIALWMLLAKPDKRMRQKRIFDVMANGDYRLTSDERSEIIENLEVLDFGANQRSIKIAKAILERIEEYEMNEIHQARVVTNVEALQIEHILPQKHVDILSWTESWTDECAQQWKHKLGNLALLNQKKNSEISNGPFEKKRHCLLESPYPRTQRAGKAQQWDPRTVEEFHKETIQWAIKVWQL